MKLDRLTLCTLLLLAAPIGCGDDDGALPDSGAREDMGEVDMARADLGEDPDLGPDPADMGEPVDVHEIDQSKLRKAVELLLERSSG